VAAGRIKQEAARIDAFIDTFGGDYVKVAIELGVQPARIDTIANFAAVDQYGVKGEGNAAGASATVLEELAALIAGGRLELPVAETFPLTEVKAAYRRLAQGHVLGKIVLVP
jgi:NADPH:quinone reductase-like Zn-dependent oxidoreductase